MSDEEECKCPPEGLPAYMGTFADLMALLMCFFVLLLSFSEMDVLKFKQIAGSMKYAFGVQNKVKVRDVPKGVSVVAQEFSPGKPSPTVIKSVMQHTVEITKETLDFDEPVEEDPKEGVGENSNKGDGTSTNVGEAEKQAIKVESKAENQSQDQSKDTSSSPSDAESKAALAAAEEKARKAAEKLAQDIAKSLSKELASGQVELIAQNKQVIIRIRESGSFASGSDRIQRGFLPVIAKIRKLLKTTDGEVRVAGHTDNVPIIDPEYFASNWELSASRAGSVVRELLKTKQLKRGRFSINGYADTRPIADNKTPKGRAKNRRVEVIIVQGAPNVSKEIQANKKGKNSKQDKKKQKK